MTFNEWYKSNTDTIIELYCCFIRDTKYCNPDVNLTQFSRNLYENTNHNCPHCDGENK